MPPCDATGAFAKCVDVRLEVLEARRALHGSRDPATLSAMDNLAFALYEAADANRLTNRLSHEGTDCPLMN